jgi:hypothetical protein
MEIRFAPFRRAHRLPLLLAGGLFLATGCSDTPRVLGPDQPLLAAGSDAGVMFNPQPDPPREIRAFVLDDVLIDTPELRPWEGSYGDGRGDGGILRVDHLLPAVQRGQTLHLSQIWNFGADATALPAV